jgi:hypothetical protein
VALLISADPSLAGQVNELENLITATTLRLPASNNCGGIAPGSVPNNTYGWGRIDALAAYEALEEEEPAYMFFLPLVPDN